MDLNPTFKLGVVPDVDQPVTIYLPKKAAGIFVNNEDSLRYAYAKETAPLREEEATVAAAEMTTSVPRYHTVRRGESLGVIAQKYRLSVTELKRLNGLHGTLIQTGQRLKVGHANRPLQPKRRPRSLQWNSSTTKCSPVTP